MLYFLVTESLSMQAVVEIVTLPKAQKAGGNMAM